MRMIGRSAPAARTVPLVCCLAAPAFALPSPAAKEVSGTCRCDSKVSKANPTGCGRRTNTTQRGARRRRIAQKRRQIVDRRHDAAQPHDAEQLRIGAGNRHDLHARMQPGDLRQAQRVRIGAQADCEQIFANARILPPPPAAKLSSNIRRKDMAEPPSRRRLRSAHWYSRRSSGRQQFRTAKRNQCLTPESAAEQEQARRVLAPEQQQCAAQLSAGALPIAGASGHQAEVQTRHGKARIEIDCRLIVVERALPSPALSRHSASR